MPSSAIQQKRSRRPGILSCLVLSSCLVLPYISYISCPRPCPVWIDIFCVLVPLALVLISTRFPPAALRPLFSLLSSLPLLLSSQKPCSPSRFFCVSLAIVVFSLLQTLSYSFCSPYSSTTPDFRNSPAIFNNFTPVPQNTYPLAKKKKKKKTSR